MLGSVCLEAGVAVLLFTFISVVMQHLLAHTNMTGKEKHTFSTASTRPTAMMTRLELLVGIWGGLRPSNGGFPRNVRVRL